MQKINAWSEGYNRGYKKALLDVGTFFRFNRLSHDDNGRGMRITGIAATKNCIDYCMKTLQSNPNTREKFQKVGGRVEVFYTKNKNGKTDKNSIFRICPEFESHKEED